MSYTGELAKFASGISEGSAGGGLRITSNNGTMLATGVIGEEIISYATSTVAAASNTELDVAGDNAGVCQVSLTVGVWDLSYSASLAVGRTLSVDTVIGRLRITDSSNNVEANTETGICLSDTVSSTADILQQNFIAKRVNLTSSKTFKLRLTCSNITASTRCSVPVGSFTSGITGNECTAYIKAVRKG